jgi:chitinase
MFSRHSRLSQVCLFTYVLFFVAPISWGEDTTAPYGINWSNAPAGSHALTAVATDNSGAATTSAAISITVSAPPVSLNPPTGLRATALKKQVRLDWTQSTSPGITQNKIYRATSNGGSYTLLATISANTNYVDSKVTPRKTYYYYVTAVGSSGIESSPSNQVSVTAK